MIKCWSRPPTSSPWSRIAGFKALGYETSSYEDMRKSLEEQSRAIQLILGGIGAVSLLVAAIDLPNAIGMSVTDSAELVGGAALLVIASSSAKRAIDQQLIRLAC